MEHQNQPSPSEAVGQRHEFYLDIDEACHVLNISHAELLRRVECGTVPAHKLWHGKQFCWKFKRRERQELIDQDGGIRELPIQ